MNDLLTALTASASFEGRVVRVSRMTSLGVINQHDLVELDDGSRYVARTYGWPWGEPEPFDRQAKEEWLLPLLHNAGVPVPEIVGSVPGAVLMSFIEGDLLGDVPEDLSAWTDAGRTLALAHEIAFDAAGFIVAGGVEPFGQGTWGDWQVDRCEAHARHLVERRPDLPVDPDAVLNVVVAARPIFDAAPIRLIHTDSHPWNILVKDGRCTGWLDWEFAWAADPAWDFVRNEFVRITDIGPTPPAFYQGYGSTPDSITFALNELALYIWMANDALYSNHIPVTYAAAERYMEALPTNLRRLRTMIA